MPETESPNYISVIGKPIWSNGQETNAMGQRRVVAQRDTVKAADINNIRDIIDIMFDHSHGYTDSVGSC